PKAGKPRKEQTLLQDLVTLTMKLAVIFAVFWLMFNYIFGVCRYMSANMAPSLRDGDLVLYFRMDREFEAGDIAVFAYKGRTLMARVVAVAGDTVDFDEQGMLVNGSHVKEQDIYLETDMFEEGVTFPVQVGDNQIFVLGDNRPHATDSRIFGCVDIDDVAGKVIGLLRRRNL
ncbi:MAG: signal peptidase I, partial [Lachnospiraceae bacterium]|nr:signal peptidase I [Lachnospiraceae bacterium]